MLKSERLMKRAALRGARGRKTCRRKDHRNGGGGSSRRTTADHQGQPWTAKKEKSENRGATLNSSEETAALRGTWPRADVMRP